MIFGGKKKSAWSVPLNDETDTIIVRKEDSGLAEIDVSQKYGHLHAKDDSGSFQTNRKVPVYRDTRIGMPRLQHRLVYYLDKEEGDPWSDPEIAYLRGEVAYEHAAEQERLKKNKRGLMDQGMAKMLMLCIGAVIVFLSVWSCGTAAEPLDAPNPAPASSGPAPTVPAANPTVNPVLPTPEVTFNE